MEEPEIINEWELTEYYYHKGLSRVSEFYFCYLDMRRIGTETKKFISFSPASSSNFETDYHPGEVEPVTRKKEAKITHGSIILAGVNIGERGALCK